MMQDSERAVLARPSLKGRDKNTFTSYLSGMFLESPHFPGASQEAYERTRYG